MINFAARKVIIRNRNDFVLIFLFFIIFLNDEQLSKNLEKFFSISNIFFIFSIFIVVPRYQHQLQKTLVIEKIKKKKKKKDII